MLTSPPVLKLWDTPGYLWLPYDLLPNGGNKANHPGYDQFNMHEKCGHSMDNGFISKKIN